MVGARGFTWLCVRVPVLASVYSGGVNAFVSGCCVLSAGSSASFRVYFTSARINFLFNGAAILAVFLPGVFFSPPFFPNNVRDMFKRLTCI